MTDLASAAPQRSILPTLEQREALVLSRWSTAWPLASLSLAKAVLQRVRAALRTGEVERAPLSSGDGTPGLSVGALRALRRALLETVRDSGDDITIGELLRLDEVFTVLVLGASNDEGARATDEELERLQRQMRGLLDQLPLAVAVVEAPSGRTLMANNHHKHIFGTSHPEAAVKGVSSYGAYVGFSSVDGHQLSATEWPLARAITKGEVIAGEVIRIRRADGSAGHIRVSASPVRDDAGTITGGAVVFDDVSGEQQTAEGLRFLADATALLSSSLDYQVTLRTLAEIAVPRLGDWCSVEMATPDGNVEQLAVAHIDPAKVALARELRRRFPPDPRMTQSGLFRVLQTGESELYEDIPEALIDLIPNEEQRRITKALGLRSGLVVPIRAHGKVLGALSLVFAESGRRYTRTDLLLTEQVAARAGLAIENAALYAKAQEAIRAREDFLSVASHELRTPLTSLHLQISTLVAKVEAGLPATLTAEKVARLDAQMLRLRALVDQLLDVGRVSSGHMGLHLEDVDLKDVVDAVLSDLASVAAEAKSKVNVVVEGKASGRWDRGRLEQVASNLISNALKYGAGKDVDVVVGAGAAGDAFFSVRDRGVGIGVEDQQRIFQRFERAASAKKFHGLGLGLWISHQIVLAHDGSISVASKLDEGSTFRVTLPTSGPRGEAEKRS